VTDKPCIILRTRQDRGRAVRWIENAPDGTVVEFKQKGRSLSQNDAVHGLIRQIIKQRPIHNGIPMDLPLWKAAFMQALGEEVRFIPTLDGASVFPVGLSTRDLPKEKFSELIEFILCWCVQEGLRVRHFDNPPPDAA
jgi:hypothetical protein